MQLIVLTRGEVELAAYRFQRHENSARKIARHFQQIEDTTKLGTCRALRRIERRFEINLGTVCYKVLETEARPISDFQRQVMEYVAYWRERGSGAVDLVVSVERVREIDRLAQGETEWLTLRDS